MPQKFQWFQHAGVKVKVCGITSLEDALKLESMGIHYLGFNFFPGSKRYIAPEAAGAIIQRLQKAVPVGIFVDENPVKVDSALRLSGAAMAQLHGAETAEAIALVHAPVIKALGISAEAKTLPEVPAGAEYALFDTRTGGSFGGTGVVFNWSLLREYSAGPPFFLAGGIGPENLAQALHHCQPYGVDLNSRVEAFPGKKDLTLVEKCLEIIASFREGG